MRTPEVTFREGECRILVVDDNVDAAEMLAALIRSFGCAAKAVTDPRDAMAIIVNVRPQLVFLDIGMPHIDGYQLARAIRKQFDRASLKLAALTGYAQRADKDEADAAGFDFHISKPIQVDTLLQLLKAFTPLAKP